MRTEHMIERFEARAGDLVDLSGVSKEFSIPVVSLSSRTIALEGESVAIDYYFPLLGQATREQQAGLRDLILTQVENPVFLPFGDDVPWSPEGFDRNILSTSQAIIILAMRRKQNGAEPSLIGYACGTGAWDQEIHASDFVTIDTGARLPIPNRGTFINDTIGVLVPYQHKGIGKDLFNHRLNGSFKSSLQWQSLCTFILPGADSMYLLEHNEYLHVSALRRHGLVQEGCVSYRGGVANYIFMRFDEEIPESPVTMRTSK